ncbi:hypothetical protein ANOM_004147 [Aspergillus nomiae NRRL 13137]|uniref:Uncharacterized protein n=1 Tax=Aspergillus nomiae NRRL (strain ATCC 15546 / NRRL 13137 / CBS 260.88 / M93) TaxID=1509407 RepID=A0A0L1J757_ASPN3|nr:uncharacterized protein ANOM_004147 [Aspergillus nomiae NRRL 13137]KNG87651.1 hypothetical protein ANOM_004147 [Aspergillus nomiae NRRL 13137]
MSYLGPFYGHVNGACIMKEIHRLWCHWKSRGTNITQCLSDEQLKLFTELDYLTPAQWNPLGGAGSAEQLEQDIITGLISSWFQQRCENDFKKTNGQYKPEPANVHRWMAHLLLTTTINIATGSKVVAFATTEDNKFSPAGSLTLAPLDLFMNFELLLKDTFSDFNRPLADFSPEFRYDDYQSAIKNLRLSLLQEWPSEAPALGSVPLVKLHEGTLGGGKQTNSYDVRNSLLVQDNEGKRYLLYHLANLCRRCHGVMNLPNTLVSQRLLWSILLLDFYNPVYSWRHRVLMQYLPRTKKLVNGKYDMEAAFVANIRASCHSPETDSPELQFLAVYDERSPPSPDTVKSRFKSYLNKVEYHINTPRGLADYMKLAESRRRIYRPLPLDEFRLTRAYALRLSPTWPLVEMTKHATVTPIPPRGLNFLNCWTGTLHAFDPKLLPQDGC